MEGFATDGDDKYFGAQKSLIGFGTSVDWNGFTLYADLFAELRASQDFLHMLQKIKWRAFNQKNDLSFGMFPINSTYLKILLADDYVSRETYGLTYGDVESKDRAQDKMECKVMLKLCSWDLIEGLKVVAGSDGLQQYLRLLTMLHDACMLNKSEITLEIRLYNLIYVVSFCRRWKSFVLNRGGKASNFLSPNS